jgi:hypothetical protein
MEIETQRIMPKVILEVEPRKLLSQSANPVFERAQGEVTVSSQGNHA